MLTSDKKASSAPTLRSSGAWTGLGSSSVLDWCGDLPFHKAVPSCVGASLTDRLVQTERPAILVQTDAPWRIVACNRAWERLCGFTAAEACGQPPSIIHGAQTDKSKAEQHRVDCVTRGAASMTILNYTKGGRPFQHSVRSEVVVDDLGSRYFLTQSSVQTRARVALCARELAGATPAGRLLAVLFALLVLALASLALPGGLTTLFDYAERSGLMEDAASLIRSGMPSCLVACVAAFYVARSSDPSCFTS